MPRHDAVHAPRAAGTPGAHLALAGVLLVALTARLWALTGDLRFDPAIYLQYAYELLHGTFSLRDTSWYAHRLAVFAPVAPLVALFGTGALATCLWPLATSLLQVAVVYRLGLRFEGPATGALAGLLVALAPLGAAGGIRLQPDGILSAFLALAAWAWIATPARGRGAAALPVLSGAAFAAALLARESAAPFALFYLGTPLVRPLRPRDLALALLGLALVLVPVLALYAAATGDPFLRFRVAAGAYGSGAMAEGARLGYYPGLLRHLRHTLTGAFGPLLALGLLGGLLAPRGWRRWALLWALPLLLYLEFGSMGLARWVPVLKRERFLEPLVPPLALLTASLLRGGGASVLRALAPRAGAVLRARWSAALLAALLAALAADSFLILRDERRAGIESARDLAQVASLVHAEPRLPVLFDHWRTGYRVAGALGFREGTLYHGAGDARRMDRDAVPPGSRLGYLRWYPGPERLPDAIVVLDDDAIARVRAARPGAPTYAAGEIPAWADPPPAAWRLLGHFGPFRVYRTRLGA